MRLMRMRNSQCLSLHSDPYHHVIAVKVVCKSAAVGHSPPIVTLQHRFRPCPLAGIVRLLPSKHRQPVAVPAGALSSATTGARGDSRFSPQTFMIRNMSALTMLVGLLVIH